MAGRASKAACSAAVETVLATVICVPYQVRVQVPTVGLPEIVIVWT
jgi:hypothetical protein